MSFIWPVALVSLLGLPWLVAGYLMLVRRNQAKRDALGSMSAVDTADAVGVAPGGRRPSGALRHLPYAMFGLALLALAIGAARPEVHVDIPQRSGTVMLVVDTSASMLADDLQPTRLGGAKDAATAFAEEQPSTIEIGVVSFGRGGFVVQQPTNVTNEVVAAIDRLAPEGATSLGAGIFTALDAIVDEELPVPVSDELDGGGDGTGETATEADLEDLDLGFYGSSTIVVFTDGEDTSGIDPLEVAALSSAAGVKVYAIGVGTEAGAIVEVGGVSQATALDEEILIAIAEATGGLYFGVADDAGAAEVFDNLDLQVEVEPEPTEVTAFAAGIAVVLLAGGAVLSMLWFGRVP